MNHRPRGRSSSSKRRNPEGRFVEQLPEKLIGDTVYDSDQLDAELAEMGVEMIAPQAPGLSETPPLPAPLARRAAVRLDDAMQADGESLRVQGRNLLGFVPRASIVILSRRLRDAF